MYYMLIVLLLLNSNVVTDARNHSRALRRNFISAVFSHNAALPAGAVGNRNKTGACRWLRGYKHQNKLCRKHKGFPEILLEARELAIASCKEQFMYYRWNCSYKRSISKKLSRETAVLQSFAASAVTHSIARACSDGKLLICRCANIPKERRHKSWKWGGCGDNVKDAGKITRRFLEVHSTIADGQERISNHNAEVGIQAVLASQSRQCACHGVSASCTVKTCWKRVMPFPKVAEKLRNAYHNAVLVTLENNSWPDSSSVLLDDEDQTLLWYATQSPNFCESTQGRTCEDEDKCATLCCGRGFTKMVEVVKHRCNCRWNDCCFPELKCDECTSDKVVNKCK